MAQVRRNRKFRIPAKRFIYYSFISFFRGCPSMLSLTRELHMYADSLISLLWLLRCLQHQLKTSPRLEVWQVVQVPHPVRKKTLQRTSYSWDMYSSDIVEVSAAEEVSLENHSQLAHPQKGLHSVFYVSNALL